MRTAFLRAPQEGTASSGQGLLRAYRDLTSQEGPIHARSVAAMGRCLLAGEPVPFYQINTLSRLRWFLRLEDGDIALHDPREVAHADRKPAWHKLCDGLDDWPALTQEAQAELVAVLTKLGFWDLVLRLVPDDLEVTASTVTARLAHFRCNAALKSSGPTDRTRARASDVTEQIALSQLPSALRLNAAVNLIVHHAKSDRSPVRLRSWCTLADDLVAGQEPDQADPIQMSVYWRGVSFLPFFDGDHQEVRRMLDRAEELGRRALADPSCQDGLLAHENMHPLLETRGRAAAAAGDQETAERYYRELVVHDPLDAKTHLRLGDHLHHRGLPEDARRCYQDAAVIGAPYTAYALTQAARCSVALDDTEHAVASLAQAVQYDPWAVTPLVLLQDLLPGTSLRGLRPWAGERLQSLLEGLGKGER
ncbi:hypothetical protein [Streptomyces sp. LN549]|uniref:hypothetical protein n=1 Tax=Streptomyces sp. LN549 TaxID=3112979 RepID=UPI00371C4345